MMQERPCLIDGRTADCGRLPDGLYVYQQVRTVGRHGLNTGRHFEILDRASREVLGFGVRSDAGSLDTQISKLLEDNGYPSDGLSFVTLRQYQSGQLLVAANPIFPYRERKLRIVYPQAGIADYELPFTEQPTSMSESATAIALRELQRKDSRIKTVIRRNTAGEILSADGAPLFIIEGRQVVSPLRTTDSVEFETAAAAAMRAGLTFATDVVDTERLLNADELFFADYRGLTAVSTCEGHLYIHLLTERLSSFF